MEVAMLEEAGISAEVFQASLMAHQHNQLLQQTVMTMQVSIYSLAHDPHSFPSLPSSSSCSFRRKISKSSPN
jgi:hypothetical protein